ncbi:MAG TPA: L-seryl-tRNA(Sec) selenium transferase [Longimicrobiales bacterium]|nr:L-seryl-tRNA(Sec) selenium transferase [Longimicrobiales bacterium]
MSDPRSAIPSVDSLLASAEFSLLLERYPRARVVVAARRSVDEMRDRIGRGEAVDGVEVPAPYARGAERLLAEGDVASLRSVINATGVVLHTNLGRAPLAASAAEAMLAAARGYTNLEFDLEAGERGSRYVHCVALLTELTGAEDALVVNNAAAALVLALNTLARGRGVVVSRGELVEIGGGFRIPEILERSGARLVEVGATNRTRLGDYEAALEEGDASVILKVHRSNFRITGFTEEASLDELAELARGRGLALLHDLGSGLMVEPESLGLSGEPRPHDSLAAGADLVAFSGDKLLGGPQAGLVLGRKDLVARMRSNPLCRALRVDKVTLAGLEATLRLYRDPVRALEEIPTLRMLSAVPEELEARARSTASALSDGGVGCEVVATEGAVGGGTFPGVTLPSHAVALTAPDPSRLAAALRAGAHPVVGRILDDRLLLDLRTVLPGQERALVESVLHATRGADG